MHGGAYNGGHTMGGIQWGAYNGGHTMKGSHQTTTSDYLQVYSTFLMLMSVMGNCFTDMQIVKLLSPVNYIICVLKQSMFSFWKWKEMKRVVLLPTLNIPIVEFTPGANGGRMFLSV